MYWYWWISTKSNVKWRYSNKYNVCTEVEHKVSPKTSDHDLRKAYQVWIIIFKVAGDINANVQVTYWITKKKYINTLLEIVKDLSRDLEMLYIEIRNMSKYNNLITSPVFSSFVRGSYCPH